MMTSRSEYRLLHRQDNADIRLSEKGYRIGLVPRERYEAVLEKYRRVEAEIERLNKTYIAPSEELKALLTERGTTAPNTGVSLADLLRRPQLDYASLKPFDVNRPELEKAIWSQAEILIKYEGYIKRHLNRPRSFKRMESRRLPEDIDYLSIQGIRTEARQKLNKIRPLSFGQASRISGVNPADMAALMVYLGKEENKYVP
jgi:tRNA uridine 5-carboxymethylaminomethyl modification enzyme